MGLIEGVISTLPGFLQGGEVVAVEFDPEMITFEELVKKAMASDCAERLFTRKDEHQRIAAKLLGQSARRSDEKVRPDKEPKYYLLQTNLRHLPMTGLQAARVNASVREGDFKRFLSPGQLDALKAIQAHPDAGWTNSIGKEVSRAWEELERVRAKIEKTDGPR